MAFLHDSAFDSGLSWVQTNGTRIDITSSEAGDYANAVGALSLGNDTGVTTGAPGDNAGNGRKVVVGAVTAGSVTGTNTATHWALTDGASVLVATGSLTPTQVVTTDNTFTLDAIDIAITDAV